VEDFVVIAVGGGGVFVCLTKALVSKEKRLQRTGDQRSGPSLGLHIVWSVSDAPGVGQ
jgi:hypothetical protein